MYMEKFRPLVQILHSLPGFISLKVCGSGSGITQLLCSVPGCSNTVIHSETLYNQFSVDKVLDYHPKQFVNTWISRQLAQRAHREAVDTVTCASNSSPSGPQPQNGLIVGIGITSALNANRERRGSSQVYLTTWRGSKNSEGVTVQDYHLELPSEWDRAKQEEEVLLFTLQCITEVFASLHFNGDCHMLAQSTLHNSTEADPSPQEVLLPSLYTEPRKSILVLNYSAAFPLELLTAGRVKMILWNRHGDVRAAAEAFGTEDAEISRRGGMDRTNDEHTSDYQVHLVYPGSFNPLHYGHTELAQAAKRVAQSFFGAKATVTFEIGTKVADKGSLDASELTKRVSQFLERGERVAITDAMLFVEKARLFPKHGFIIGIDTARRVLDPKYYEGQTEEHMIAALLSDIDENGNFFLVAGRKSGASAASTAEREDGLWEDLSKLHIPPQLRHMFITIPECEFRVDVSSTEIRERLKRGK